MKRILTIGIYGALIGVIIGIAVVCGIWLLSDYLQDFRFHSPYIEHTVNKSTSMDRSYLRSFEFDELERETEIVFGYIKVGDINGAITFFNSIKNLSTKWNVLFELERQLEINIKPAIKLSHKTIEFIQMVMPKGENKERRDLLILLGNDYLKIKSLEKAKIAFKEAAEIHNKISQNKELTDSQVPLRAVELKALSKSFSDRGFSNNINETTISLGKIILFPLLFGAIGFILSVILKPALEAFGKAIIAPAIAKKIGSNEMMKELNIKENNTISSS